MSAVRRSVGNALSAAWSALRELSGDSAYETYLAHARRRGEEVLTREQFYLDSVVRRYSRVSRCC